MKKLFALAMVCGLLAATSCKDDVYLPIKDNVQIDENVDVDFDPGLLYPVGGDENPEGTGNDDDSAVNTDTGKAYIYIFPDDALSFTLTGLSQTDVSKFEILVNDKLVDSYESPNIPDPLSYTVDRSLFRPGRNVLTLRYTFPNGAQVFRNYYFVVFTETPSLGLDYSFVGMVSIGDTQANPSPSTITVICDAPDQLVDMERHKFYFVAGKVTTESVLATDADGRYGDLWQYTMSLMPSLNKDKGNVDVRNFETEILWDGTVKEDIFRCTAQRTNVKDLNWEHPFDLQQHTVTVNYEYTGYLKEAGETYFISAKNSERFAIDAKHPQSRKD